MLFIEVKQVGLVEDRIVINLSHVTSAAPVQAGKATLVQMTEGKEFMLKIAYEDFAEMVSGLNTETIQPKKEAKISKASK